MKHDRSYTMVLHLLCASTFLAAYPDRAATQATIKDSTHITVRHEPGRYFGWPANGGIWSWGDEILVQYRHGEFQDKPPGSHDINFQKPIVVEQARSPDGGLTWTHEAVPIATTEPGWGTQPLPANVPSLVKPIDFSHPDTILRFEWAGYLYYSSNRGKEWKGPFALPKLGLHTWQLRTDYLVEDRSTVLAFWSGSKERFKRDENGGMVYMVKSRDGGLRWELVSRISRLVEPAEDRHDVALMPSTVRVSPTKLVTCIRNLTLYPKVGWIDCRSSTDNGRTWRLLSIPVNEEAGTSPPALSRLPDGRLVLTYGYRKPLRGPTSIRAMLSKDDGASWGPEIILRTGGGDEDIGYTRNVVRPDGKVVTIYYWQEDEKAERVIAATIWTPPAPQTVAGVVEGVPGNLVLTVVDEVSDQPTPARVEVLDSKGNSYVAEDAVLVGPGYRNRTKAWAGNLDQALTLLSRSVMNPYTRTTQFYSAEKSRLELPPGRYKIRVFKGTEYKVQSHEALVNTG